MFSLKIGIKSRELNFGLFNLTRTLYFTILLTLPYYLPYWGGREGRSYEEGGRGGEYLPSAGRVVVKFNFSDLALLPASKTSVTSLPAQSG